MRLIALALAVTAAGVAGSSAAMAGGLGWGPRYNDHLSSYEGRPLGPPVSAYGPVYDDGDPRSLYSPRYDYVRGRLVVTPGEVTYPARRRYRPSY